MRAGAGGASAGYHGSANAAWVEPTTADAARQGEFDADQIVDAVVSSLQVPLPAVFAGQQTGLPGDLSLAQAVATAERYTGATAVDAQQREDDPTHYEVELVNAGGLLVALVDRHGSGVTGVVY